MGKAGPGCDRRAVSVQLGTAPALQGAVNTRSDVPGSSGEVQPYQPAQRRLLPGSVALLGTAGQFCSAHSAEIEALNSM